MKHKTAFRTGAFLVSAVMTISSLSLPAAAESAVIEGKYSFSTNGGDHIRESDSFVYRDDCFERSSFDWCSHLMTLSAQASIVSAGFHGKDDDPEQIDDPSENAANILKMLEDMQFSDPEANRYYTLEKQENSVGVALGHKEITDNGKTYTLLAVFPRSDNYKQEWSGNFNIGTGTLHTGFRSARDEVLRFIKQYMTEHDIKGDLKVWVAGHSRGSSVSNLVGAFFAGGGIDYFDDVSITPEDVYCYCFSAPPTALQRSIQPARPTRIPEQQDL